MKWIDNIREWAVTVVVYVAEGSPREASFLAASLAVDASPVTLSYDAMKSAAVDCYLYSPLTGIVCTGKGMGASAQALQKYCQDPQTGKLTA